MTWARWVLGALWLIPRAQIAVAPASGVVYSVEGFGATADDASDDDTPGIQAAIDAAIDFANVSGETATILLRGGGEYRLKSGKRGRGHLDLSCADGRGLVVFDGAGAKLVVETPRLGFFYLDQSSLVRIQDVELDLEPLPYIPCRVTAVDEGARTVQAQPFPGATNLAQFPGYSAEWGWIHDEEVLFRPKRGVASAFTALERHQSEPGGAITFTMAPSVVMSDFVPGDVLSFLYRRGNNFRIQACENIELARVISYGAGLFFVSTHHISGLDVHDCAVLVRPGRLQATGGDGIHLKYGRNIRIENCYFEGLSDDGVNVSATNGFRIEGCEFHGKRRQSIVLDTDGVPYRSRNGVIKDNVALHNGNSFLYHDGGDYSSVEVSGTRAFGNNRSTSVEQSFTGRLVGRGPGGLSAEPRPLAWSSDGTVSVGDASGGFQYWRMLRLATPRGHRWRLEAHRPGGPQPWLYLTLGDGLRVERSRVGRARQGPERTEVDAQLWIQERVGEASVRLRHEKTGRYLDGTGGTTVDPAEAGIWTLLMD